MLAGDIYQPHKIRLVETPEAAGQTSGGLQVGEMIFQPELACLCGSDLVFLDTGYPEYPPRLGHSLHEMIGLVVEANGGRFLRGDRVLCVPVNQQGLFERFRVDQQRAIPLDRRPLPEEAVMAQPLGTVIYALRRLPPLINQVAAVVGQGPIGQLFNAALRNLGAREIIGLDRLSSRLQVSPRMGATAVVDVSAEDPAAAVSRITGGELADLVIEAVGHREQTLNLCIDLCRPQGRILQFGLPTRTIDQVQWYNLVFKNITLHASIHPDFTVDFPLAMRWIAERRLNVAPLITHRFPLQDIQEAFDTFRQRRDGALKVLIEFPASR